MKNIFYFFLWFWIFIILISFTNAQSLTHKYTFNSSTIDGNTIKDLVGIVNATNVSADFISSGIFGGAFNYTAISNDYMTLSSELVNEGSSFTISCWIKPSSLPASTPMAIYGQLDNPGANFGFYPCLYGAYYCVGHAGVRLIIADETISVGEKVMYTYVYDYGSTPQNRLYSNKTLLTLDATENGSTILTGSSNSISIGDERAGAYDNEFNGLIDECLFYDYALSSSDISDLYNSYFISSGGATLTINTDMINNTILNSSYNNITINYNGTYSGTDELFNCSLMTDGISINSSENINLSENQQYIINIENTAQIFNFTLGCNNTDISNIYSDIYVYKVDTINPTLTVTGNLINNTEYYTNQILNIIVTANDSNIFAVNITIFDLSDTVIENYFAENLTGTGYINDTSRVLNTVGNYTLKIQVWDSHTSKELTDKLYRISDNIYQYKDIIIYSNNKLSYEKKIDKYQFIIDKNSVLCYKTLNYFREIPNSKYNYHFIDFENKIWIDDLNIPFNKKYENGKLNEICIENKDNKPYKTKSIGDLNYIEESYYYNVLSQDTLILTDIYNILNETYEVFIMLGLLIISGVFIIAGVMSRLYYLWTISAIPFLINAVIYFNKYANSTSNVTYKVLAWSFFMLTVLLSFVGILLQLGINKRNKDLNDDDFYLMNYKD